MSDTQKAEAKALANKKYKEDHAEEIRLYMKEYREKNKAAIKEYCFNYDLTNKDKIREVRRKYREANPELIAVIAARFKENNPGYISRYARVRRKHDPLYRLQHNVRSLISGSFYNKGIKKNSKTEKILGCTYAEFKTHLESQFEPWMSFDNYGSIDGKIPSEQNQCWDIDHIIPISSAKTEEDILKLNHYTNLHPLCSYYNRFIKKNKN